MKTSQLKDTFREANTRGGFTVGMRMLNYHPESL